MRPALAGGVALLLVVLLSPMAVAGPQDVMEQIVTFRWGERIDGSHACAWAYIRVSGVTVLDVSPCLG